MDASEIPIDWVEEMIRSIEKAPDHPLKELVLPALRKLLEGARQDEDKAKSKDARLHLIALKHFLRPGLRYMKNLDVLSLGLLVPIIMEDYNSKYGPGRLKGKPKDDLIH